MTIEGVGYEIPDKLAEEIAQKISLGKINKFKDENSLMTQEWVMDPKMKVRDVIKNMKLLDFNINEFVRLKIGE